MLTLLWPCTAAAGYDIRSEARDDNSRSGEWCSGFNRSSMSSAVRPERACIQQHLDRRQSREITPKYLKRI